MHLLLLNSCMTHFRDIHPKPIRPQETKDTSISLDEFLQIERSENISPEIVQYAVNQIFEKLSEQHFTYMENVNDVLAKPWGEILVRREDPKKIINILTSNAPIKLTARFSEQESDRYLNSALWKPGESGISGAFMEGFSHTGGVVTIEGIKLNDKLSVQAIPNSAQYWVEKDGKITDRTRYRSVEGDISKNDILFLIFRIPIDRFPTQFLNETEKDMLDEYLDELETWKNRSSGHSIPKPQIPSVFRGFINQNSQ